MARPDSGERFLEIGLLLIVTGMFVGVLLLGLDLVLARESSAAPPALVTMVSVLALSAVLGVVLLLVRRVKRLFQSP